MRARIAAAIVAVVGCGPSAAAPGETAQSGGEATSVSEDASTRTSTASSDGGDGTTSAADTSDEGDDVLCVLHEQFDVGPPGCAGDDECGPGSICVESQCMPGECHDSTDCPDGELCVSHFCEDGVQVSACADAPPWTAEPIDTWATWVIADVAVTDVNGDGADDLLAVEFHAPDSTLHVVDGAERTSIAAMLLELTAFRLALTDLDGNGRTDVLVAGRDPAGALGLATIAIDGVGLPGQAVMLPAETCDPANEVAAVDLNGDGPTDAVVLVSSTQNRLQWRAGDGAGALQPGAWIDDLHGASRMTAADLDGDGATDLVLATPQGRVALVRGGATPEAMPHDAWELAPGEELATADLDGDGAVDLLAAGGDASTAAIDLAVGTGGLAFAEPTRVLVPGGFAHGLAAVDLDDDGDLDLAFGAASGGITLLRMGAGVPECAVSIPMDARVAALAVGDIDGDTTPDLVGSAELDGAGTLFVVPGG